MKLTISEIAQAIDGRITPSTDIEKSVVGFFSDSRTPSDDRMFLALRGETVDGNRFVPELLEKGYCALADNGEYVPDYGSCILVDDVRDALQRLAIWYRENIISSTKIVGITGSVGKTTTKDMVALGLASSLSVAKTIGNSNSQIGLPQTVLSVEQRTDCAVVELGMSMPGEMSRISRCAAPHISLITNVGYSHIENLGSREAIRDEKLDIAKYSADDAILVLDGDEPLLRDCDYGNKRVVFVSNSSDTDSECYASEISNTGDGVSFIGMVFGREVSVSLPVRGNHFVKNSLFALAVAHLLGLDLDRTAKALSAYESDGKRQYIYEQNGHRIISDCYNASPESMRAALDVLSSYSESRRIAVLGDMLELGSTSDMLHSEVGKLILGRADALVTYGDKASFIASEAGIPEVYSFSREQRRELKSFLDSFVCKGDTVLYKASNGMKMSELIV